MSAVHEADTSPMTMTAIAILVAQAHGLTLDELRTPTRAPKLVTARQEAMRRLRRPGLAGPGGQQYTKREIGDFFGVTEHAISAAMEGEHPAAPVGRRTVLGRLSHAPSFSLPTRAPSRQTVDLSVSKHSAAFDSLFAQAFADGGFGALQKLIEEARARLANRKRDQVTAEGWIV